MQLLLKLLLLFWLLIAAGCSSNQSIRASNEALSVIANPKATTNQLILALKSLRDSKVTNEPPQFWTAIANNPKYGVDHRRRAVMQLLARHFHSGMTFGEIGQLFNHATWIDQRGVGGGPAGILPPGVDESDGLAYAFILLGNTTYDRSSKVWFRFTHGYMGTADDLYWCLEDKLTNPELAKIRVIGIISAEDLPGLGLTYNAFGIPP